jgi:hypothetical protein
MIMAGWANLRVSLTTKPHLGAIMAQLILTGKHEAIKLQGLHGEQVLELDKKLTDLTQRNGGFGQWLIEIKRGVLDFLTCSETCSLKPRKHIPTA